MFVLEPFSAKGHIVEFVHWPVVAMLLAHEDPVAPYSSELCCKKSQELLSTVVISDDILTRIFSVIKPRLSKDTWQYFIGKFRYNSNFEKQRVVEGKALI